MSFDGFLSSNSHEDKRHDMAEINMVPLIDVMLVLLVVFMVAAPLSISGIKVQLPTSEVRSSGMSAEKIVLTVDRQGRFFINKMVIAPEKLQERIAALYEVRADKALYIRADEGVRYGKVVDVMSQAKLAGVGKIAMLTTPPVLPKKDRSK